MNDKKIKAAAEEIVKVIKENGGGMLLLTFSFKDYPLIGENLIQARHMLLSYNLIESTGQKSSYRLTPDGYRFSTFEEYEKKIELAERHEIDKQKLTKWELFKAKYWWLIAIVSAIVGAALDRLINNG